eukprot:UC1_evm1s1738
MPRTNTTVAAALLLSCAALVGLLHMKGRPISSSGGDGHNGVLENPFGSGSAAAENVYPGSRALVSGLHVFVSDEHQHALPRWYKYAAAAAAHQPHEYHHINQKGQPQHQPQRGYALVHFDAHSDMACPSSYRRAFEEVESVLVPPFSFEDIRTSNDEFIEHAIYTGLVRTLVWVLPDWASEFEGENLGEHWHDGHLSGRLNSLAVGVNTGESSPNARGQACDCLSTGTPGTADHELECTDNDDVEMKVWDCALRNGAPAEVMSASRVQSLGFELMREHPQQDKLGPGLGLGRVSAAGLRNPASANNDAVRPPPPPPPQPPVDGSDEGGRRRRRRLVHTKSGDDSVFLSYPETDSGSSSSLSSPLPIILDIDEDYFVTEDPVARLISGGWTNETLANVDRTVTYVFCPHSVLLAEAVDAMLRTTVRRPRLTGRQILSLPQHTTLRDNNTTPQNEILCSHAKSWAGVTTLVQAVENVRAAINRATKDETPQVARSMRKTLVDTGFGVLALSEVDQDAALWPQQMSILTGVDQMRPVDFSENEESFTPLYVTNTLVTHYTPSPAALDIAMREFEANLLASGIMPHVRVVTSK